MSAKNVKCWDFVYSTCKHTIININNGICVCAYSYIFTYLYYYKYCYVIGSYEVWSD